MSITLGPVPTYAPVSYSYTDKKTGKTVNQFSPAWLQWFLDVSALSNGSVQGSVNLTTQVTGVLHVVNGGTYISGYNIGDLLYASGANVLSRLAIGATAKVLSVAGGVPVWIGPGISATITTAKLTGTGANGSMTFTNGILTAHTDAS